MNVDPLGTVSWTKIAAIVAVAAVVVVSVAATIATFGATSVAGTMAISASITIACTTTEVISLQVKKSKQDGDSGGEIFDDVVDSLYDNGSRIVAEPVLFQVFGITKQPAPAGYGRGTPNPVPLSYYKDFVSKQAPLWRAFFAGVKAGADAGHMTNTLLTKDPEKRAKERGGQLN